MSNTDYLKDKGLSLSAKGLLAIMIQIPDADPNDFTQVKKYVKEEHAHLIFDELQEQGYLDFETDTDSKEFKIKVRTEKNRNWENVIIGCNI